MSYIPKTVARPDRYHVAVQQYVSYQRNGYLKVASLIAPEDIGRLRTWADDLLYGRVNLPGVEPPAPDTPFDELVQRFTRLHQLHRADATAEWGLLHARVLDVLEALIGPDVLALQSMLFLNPPGRGGQGWHQDAYYITTYPDTLIGAWVALEPADEENGCLWVVPGSQAEPIYPARGRGSAMHTDGAFEDLVEIEHASSLNDEANTLTQVAAKYPPPIPVPMNPGDVLFFHSHLLHRSYPNQSSNRFRRSYVLHYCNARSWVPWNHGVPYAGDAANSEHILARGQTHLPYAHPAFGTAVDLPHEFVVDHGQITRMMGMSDGTIAAVKQEVFAFERAGEDH